MLRQMGNEHGKGTKSGDRKNKKHSTKESTCLDGGCPSPQGVQNGDSQQVKEGHRLFLEEQARRKRQMKDLKEKVKVKSCDPESDAERQLRHQAGISSMSSSLDTNEHYKSVTQGSNNSMNHEPPLHDGSRHKTRDTDERNGVDFQGDSHLQQSSAHLSGNESDNAHVSVPPGGVPMPLNQQDLVNESAPTSPPPEFLTDPPPSGQSNIVNTSVPVGDPQSSEHDVPARVVYGDHNNAATPVGQDGNHDDPALSLDHTYGIDANRGCEGGATHVEQDGIHDHATSLDHTDGIDAIRGCEGGATHVGQDGIHDDPATSLDHADGIDTNRSCEGGATDEQNTLNSSPTTVHASVAAPTTEAELNNHSQRKSHRVPQEQNDYNQDAASNQSTSLTPQSKIESSAPPVMQMVSGITEKTGSSHEEAGKLNVGEQSLSKAVRDNALLLEKISKYLDRENRVIKCWKHLAYVLDVPAEETRKFDHFTEHSPTDDMFGYLVDSWRPELTIKELKEKLNKVYRNDIIEGLIKGGFRDDMLVSDLMSGQPAFIALLSSKLDGETRTIGNWQSLATQFGIRKQITEQFGLRGCGPTGALFLHMQTDEGLRGMTMGQLCKHFKGMERNDLVKILAKYNFSEETDSSLVINEVVDGSELLAEIGERLNKEIRAVKNWRNLAYRLKIPLEVYNMFDTSKAAAKSPTKMMFDWLAQWKPGLHVDDLLKGLKKIDRFDVVDLVTNEVSAEIARKKQADSIDSGTTLQFAAKQAFSDLQQMHRDADKQHSQLNLVPGLVKKALERGLMVSDNVGEGNCMFYALAEQLKVRKETTISHGYLRKVLVHYLKEHPKLPDGTDLYSFVYGYPSWKDYLEGMDKDGTWGDHVILFTAANCCRCVIRVISSVLNSEDVIILPNPPVQNAVELVLGHIFEAHYVSLIPMSAVSDGVSGYRQLPPPYTTSTQLMRSQGQHQLPGYHQIQDQQLPQRHQQPADQKQRYSTCDKNMVEVRELPYRVYNKICIKLNIKRDFFDDFRMVAEQLGMDRDSTELAEQDKNPTHHIFSQRCPNVKVRDLVEALHKIERMDVAEELERWIAEA